MRRVEVHRLLRDAAPLLLRQIVERAHVVQAVRELDEDDADILRDREQQLAVILDLALLAALEGERADLGDAVHDLRHLRAELALDVGHRHGGVLHHVVDEAAGDRHGVEMQLGEDLRDLHAVHDVRLARGALLPVVRRFAEPIGAREQIGIEPREQLGVEVPPGDHALEDRNRHSRPASAKLVYRPRPTIT